MKRRSAQELALIKKQKLNCLEEYSIFASLLATRPHVPAKILPRLDELILFVIDKMVNEHVDFIGSELCQTCCWRDAPLNCSHVRALLETEKFDLHEGYGDAVYSPMFSLISSVECNENVPSSVLYCINLLLKTKGFDVNYRFEGRNKDVLLRRIRVLEVVTHPEIAKLLLRNGMDINSVSTYANGAPGNALHFAILRPYNPHV